MARRIPRTALSATFAALVALAGAAAPVRSTQDEEAAPPVARFEEAIDVRAPPLLFRFSFDGDEPVTGPDTIAVFEHARGRVRLSRELVRSGWHSLRLSDVAGDGDFPELQAFFPVRRAGRLTLSFALLVVDPREELNVALAGPAGFGLGRDGIAFWLATRDGWLTHVTDSIPRKLVEIRPFVWYGVEVVYEIEQGRYSLQLFEEGRPEPVVALERQPNAPNQPGSALNLVSFIGDNSDDLSNVVYFIDDVQLASDPAPTLPPFVAPGRRRLFVEMREGYREPLGAVPACPPALALEDFGLDADGNGAAGVAALLAAATGAPGRDGAAGAQPRDLEAARRWREGCTALARSDFKAAEREFRAAVEASDSGRGGAFLYRDSLALALLGARRIGAAEAIAAELSVERRDDPRVAALAARLAAARGFAGEAESWFRDAVAASKSPALLEATAAGAFHWLMHEKRWGEAEAFALRMVERHAQSGTRADRARWIERGGDAAFAAGEPNRAGEAYRRARELEPELAAGVDLKLADVAFVLGDLETERLLRERIYGALRAAE